MHALATGKRGLQNGTCPPTTSNGDLQHSYSSSFAESPRLLVCTSRCITQPSSSTSPLARRCANMRGFIHKFFKFVSCSDR
eukprot:5811191-Amphidinium_carterae.1